MHTFSYNNLDSNNKLYTNNSDIDSIISNLPDNNNNLINPKDIRDAIYTNYVSTIFKETNVSGFKYIGIDSDNAGILVKEPFYFGKRQLNGNDIMNNTLLTNGTDIFFFNNNSDSGTQSTKITILAGGSSILYNNAPYIQSYPYISSIDLNIVNNNGNIKLISASPSYVSINNIVFPNTSPSIGNSLVVDSIGSDNNYYLSWKDTTSSGVYTNSTPMPSSFQGFSQGTTFSNTPISDIIKGILYPYVSPTVVLNTSYQFYNYSGGVYSSTTDTIGNKTIEYGTKISSQYIVNYNINIVSNNATITSSNGLSQNVSAPRTISGSESIAFNTTNFSYNITVNDTKSNVFRSIGISYAYPIWFGVLGLGTIYNSIFGNALNGIQSNIVSASFSSARYVLNAGSVDNYSLTNNNFSITPTINGCLMVMFPTSRGSNLNVRTSTSIFTTETTFGNFSLTFSNYTYWNNIQYSVYYYKSGGINSQNGPYFTVTSGTTYQINIS